MDTTRVRGQNLSAPRRVCSVSPRLPPSAPGMTLRRARPVFCPRTYWEESRGPETVEYVKPETSRILRAKRRPSVDAGLRQQEKRDKADTYCRRVTAVCTSKCFTFSHRHPHPQTSGHLTPAAALGCSPPIVSARSGPAPLGEDPSCHGVAGLLPNDA